MFVPNFLPLATRVDEGDGTTADQFAICCDGATVHAVWSGDDGNLYYKQSTDAATTWPALPVDFGPHSVNNYLRMCCSGAYVHICWDEGGLINVLSSQDSGATWGGPVSIDGADLVTGDFSDYPSICCDGARVYVAWEDERGPSPQTAIWFNRSTDGGLSWLPDAIQASVTENADDPTICCEGLGVVVAYASLVTAGCADPNADPCPSGHIALVSRSSTDGGSTWGAEARADLGFGHSRVHGPPAMDCGGGSAYVAWNTTNDQIGPVQPPFGDMHGSSTTFASGTWAGDILLEQDGVGTGDASGSSYIDHPQSIYSNGGYAVVAWTENRPASSGVYQVRAVRVVGGAVSFSGDGRIQTNPLGAAHAFDVCLSGSDDNVYAAWEDARDGGTDVRFNYSTDGGVSWSVSDILLSVGGASANATRVVCSGVAVHVAWEDNGQIWVRSSQ